MLHKLFDMLSELNDAIEYAELQDLAYTKYYSTLIKERNIIRRTIERFKRIERWLWK